MRRPIAEWPLALTAVSTHGDLQDIERELSANIQRAVLLHGYLSHRYNTGCGEQSHESSAKKANRNLVKVRKGMGFSYPNITPIQIQP